MKVLLVDDEERFVTALAKRLRLRGIDADYVFSGEEAFIKAAETSYDVVVLDVKMPGISGIELRRGLEEVDPDLRFIFFTGHGSEADFKVGSEEASFYLPKPLDMDELIRAIQTAFEQRPKSTGNEES
jgi:DNA-binding response OmpR family regulator